MPAAFCIDFSGDDSYFSVGIVVVVVPGVEETVFEIGVVFLVVVDVVVCDCVSL